MSERARNSTPTGSLPPPTHPDACEQSRFLWLPVTEIRPYERNPRRADNPEADRLMASIRASGMDQPLVVTRRPGDTHYLVWAGGNTRLRIVQALFAQTGDPRFARVPCLLRPWGQESDVLLAHLKENDLRGPLTFIDKARAVAEAKRLLEVELGEGLLSQRRLEALLKTRGYGLSHGLIARMTYAVARLLPAMPQALEAGLGRPQVERLRTLDRAACALWQHHGLGDDEAFGAVFAQLCRRYDGPDWDIEPLRGALETELAEQAEVSIHTVRAQFAARLAGQETWILPGEAAPEAGPQAAVPAGRANPAPTPDGGTRQTNDERAAALPQDTGGNAVVADDSEDVDGLDHRDEARDADAADQDARANRTTGSAGSSSRPPIPLQANSGVATDPPRPGEPTLPTDLKSLRARAWTLAARLAQRHGIGELVAPLPSQGLGFVLRDVPDPALAEQLDVETLSRLSGLWRHLAACAEMTVAPQNAVLAALDAESILARALKTGDAGLLFASVWTLDPGHMGHRLWRLLDGRDWQDLLDLMTTYRTLHQVAESTQTALWC